MDTKKGKKAALEAVKGAVTGASMLVPGVSGGTMALIFGFYDRLIKAASSIRKTPKKSICTLLFYMLFVGLGFFAFSAIMKFLLETIGLPMYLFFIGTILSSIPLLFKKTEIHVFKVTDFLFLIGGILVVVLLTLVPEGLFDYSGSNGFSRILILLAAGLLLAVALVLPGISFSHMLLVMGLYETVLASVKAFNLPFLIPLGIFSLAGVACIVKFLNYSMQVFKRQTFMTIIGFVVASSVDIFIKNVAATPPQGIWIFYCVLAFVLGSAITLALSRFSK